MNSNPLVSIIMPVYNADEQFFRKAAESILDQTFKNFEFIIINDGSTNNIEDVILSYNDNRIKYFKNETNLKIIKTLNKGLELAKGKYIARIDSDDYSEISRIEKQVKYLEENPNVGLLGTCFEHVPENKVAKIPTAPNDVKLYLRYCQNCIVHSSVMFRKDLLDKYNLKYNEAGLHAEDYMLWSQLSRVCDVAVYPEVLTYYRKNPDGISLQNKEFQNKIVTVIILGNIIRDFPCDKDYMYNIQKKYAKSEPISEEEYYTCREFLTKVADYLENKITPPHNTFVKRHILSITNKFIKYKFG